MKSFPVLFIAILCGTLIPAGEGLTCYKNLMTDANNAGPEISDKTPTEVCGTASSGSSSDSPGGASPNPATTEAAAPAYLVGFHAAPKIHSRSMFAKLGDPSYYCFTALLTNAENKTVVERGCKEDAKTDNCLVLPAGVTLSSCKVCEEDKCNSGGSMAILSIQCGLVLVAVFAKFAFQQN